MLSYAAALADFSSALADSGHASTCLSDSTRARIAVYRNNARLNRMDALPAAFPAVLALVGHDYFRALARAYVIVTPARSANLHDDGASFADFIAGFAPAGNLPYLADVARLDWARHRAYYADDAPLLDAARLANLSPEQFATIALAFHPSVALVQSANWPIGDLLALCEYDNEHGDDNVTAPIVQLDAGGQAVLVWRSARVCAWRRINGDEAEWLNALLAGATIGDALTMARQDPNALLAHLFTHRLVSQFRLPEDVGS